MRHTTATAVAIAGLTVLVLGGMLSLAAAPSRPGMFLYPIRTLTQRVTGTLIDTVVIAVPAALREETGGGRVATREPDEPATATPATMPGDATAGAVDFVNPRLQVATAAVTLPAVVGTMAVAPLPPTATRVPGAMPSEYSTQTPVPGSYVESLVPAPPGAAVSGRPEATGGSTGSDGRTADGPASHDPAPGPSPADGDEPEHDED